jgi:Trypsin-like peptidase domain
VSRAAATAARRSVPAVLAAAALVGCGSHGHAAPPAVFAVTVRADQPSGEHATAWVLRPGRLVTVAHVLRAGRPVSVGGRRARVVRVDRRLDLAVLAVPGLHTAAARRAAPRAGERVTIRALRGSLPATVRRLITAHVSGADGGPAEVRPALELAAAVQPGDSGAPVTAGGRVVGMVFAAATDRDVAYALDVRAVAGA